MKQIPEPFKPATIEGGGGQEIETYANFASFPATGVEGVIYIALDTDITYIWDGAAYKQIDSIVPVIDNLTTASSTSALSANMGKTLQDNKVELGGISGGQTIYGGTDAGDNITLSSTSHATKGKIYFGANSVYDEVNDRFGIRNTAPDFLFQVTGDGTNGIIVTQRVSGADMYMNATLTHGNFGTFSNHPTRIVVNVSPHTVFNLDGSITSLGTYSAIVGGTNRDLYVDDTGLIGYVSSALKYKENIRDISALDIENIFKLPVKKFDYKDAEKGINQIGIIAEDMEQYFPELCSYKYEYVEETQQDEEGNDILVKIPVLDEQGNHINEIETVQYSKVGLLALLAVKELKTKIDALEARISALENP
jgi:hypothetical protein